MHVLTPMTEKTVRRNGDLAGRRLPMAGAAIQPLVGTRQRVVGTRRMVKTPDVPAVGRMTKLALLSQPVFVLVELSMARDASPGRCLVVLSQVALFTRYYRVQTGERKASKIVVEQDICRPASIAVAPLAVPPLDAGMDVVAQVAAVAVGW